MGFIRHAIVLSFYYLLMAAVNKKDLFDTATRQIIALGGDTDTNACIVCGMIGAIVGIGNIHKDFIASVISYDFKE